MSLSEDEITAWFAKQRRLSPADFPIGIGDDMAEVTITDRSVFITTDMLLQDVHFDLRTATLRQVGYKAMAVSLSDCAAMATLPLAAVVAVALPKGFGAAELKKLHSGIVRAGDRFDCALVGGDIVRWKSGAKLAINVAMLSRKAGVEPLRRCGAGPAEAICVTGSLGGAIAGRHLRFQPRVKEAIKIASLVAVNSMIDISDGLSSDLNRICTQSHVGAIVDAKLLPISRQAHKSKDPLASALNDGEDFELLFTLSHENCRRLLQIWNEPTPVTKIGCTTRTGKVKIKMPDGRTLNLNPLGYDHLR